VANKSGGQSTGAPVINFLRSLGPMAFQFVEHLPNPSKAATVAIAFASAHHGLV
jgi:hypothetical protein